MPESSTPSGFEPNRMDTPSRRAFINKVKAESSTRSDAREVPPSNGVIHNALIFHSPSVAIVDGIARGVSCECGAPSVSGWHSYYAHLRALVTDAIENHVREHGPLPLGDDCVVVAREPSVCVFVCPCRVCPRCGHERDPEDEHPLDGIAWCSSGQHEWWAAAGPFMDGEHPADERQLARWNAYDDRVIRAGSEEDARRAALGSSEPGGG